MGCWYVPYLDLGGGYTGVDICKNSSSSILKIELNPRFDLAFH